MGILINGQTDTISASDGSLNISDYELSVSSSINITGIITAGSFVGNLTGNLNSSGVNTATTISGTTATYATGNLTTANITTGNIVTGIVTTLSGTTATYATGNLTTANITTGNIVTGIVTTLSGTTATYTTFNGNVNATTGVSTFTNVVVAAGSTAAPSITPTGDSNTGIFFPSADTIAIAEGGTEALRIDSSGRVTMPYQPAFSARNVSGGTLSGNIVLNTIILNNGGHYSTSTGNFTAPVAGMYYFSFTGFTENNSSGSSDISIEKNGTAIVRTFTSEATNTYRPFAVDCIVSLAANDAVRPHSGIQLHGNLNPNFSGHLIG